jgi:phosphotransferase system IIB component
MNYKKRCKKSQVLLRSSYLSHIGGRVNIVYNNACLDRMKEFLQRTSAVET